MRLRVLARRISISTSVVEQWILLLESGTKFIRNYPLIVERGEVSDDLFFFIGSCRGNKCALA